MILVKQLDRKSEYRYIPILYAGLSAFDYLTGQLSVYLDQGFDEFRLDLKGELYLQIRKAEIVPKSLRKCALVENIPDGTAKSITIPCVSLSSPSPTPDETGLITLWYDIIELSYKRAEKSLAIILDKYMKLNSGPYYSSSHSSKKRNVSSRQRQRKTRRT